MKKILRNQKGISLIEILAGIPLAAVVFAIFGIALSHFIITYQETQLYTQLQQDLFNAIETMRYGYALEGVTDDEGLIGLMTAEKVEFSTSRTDMTIKPIVVDPTYIYKSTFSVNDDKQLEVRSTYGVKYFRTPKLVFPSTPKKMIGSEPQFKILNPRNIWTVLKTDNEGNALLLKIELEAQVRFRERKRGQSRSEDIRRNTRTIRYETSVFLGNAQEEA